MPTAQEVEVLQPVEPEVVQPPPVVEPSRMHVPPPVDPPQIVVDPSAPQVIEPEPTT